MGKEAAKVPMHFSTKTEWEVLKTSFLFVWDTNQPGWEKESFKRMSKFIVTWLRNNLNLEKFSMQLGKARSGKKYVDWERRDSLAQLLVSVSVYMAFNDLGESESERDSGQFGSTW